MTIAFPVRLSDDEVTEYFDTYFRLIRTRRSWALWCAIGLFVFCLGPGAALSYGVDDQAIQLLVLGQVIGMVLMRVVYGMMNRDYETKVIAQVKNDGPFDIRMSETEIVTHTATTTLAETWAAYHNVKEGPLNIYLTRQTHVAVIPKRSLPPDVHPNDLIKSMRGWIAGAAGGST
ncbi:MAG: hypothetical protein AAF386_04725 [Pseudomonadota bacterium]